MNASALLDQFLSGHMAAGHSPKTVEWYKYEIQRFFDWLLISNLGNGNWLHPHVIERYLADSRAAGNAPATVAGHYRALRGFFNWLVQRRFILESPMVQVAPVKVPKKSPRRAELAEFDRLLESIAPVRWIDLRDKLIINVLFLCGLRLSECTALTAADFRTQEHLLVVRKGKGGHERFVPLLPAVEKAFVVYLFARPHFETDRLFLGANGAGKANSVILPGGIRQMVKRRCKRAGIRNLNPHSFRHGLAMSLLNRGGDMSLVQKILGHSQISTTSRYYAEWLTDGMLREFTAKMHGIGGA